ncbi:MliC family protein [Mycobacterium sp. TY814]|uniref:MliC family protein n=1 Tax=unclassified Mycobacterium TaxID=2642494 RepID=UPI0027414007|nr:MliC family protein [Mycobacterium sp. TY814]MDP7720846.1 MliC family protein [Mycobacterium sp. TY814]
MRLLVVVLAVLLVSACSSKSGGTRPTTQSSSSSATTSTQPPAPAMTFDCAKPANKAQQSVCDDPQLTDLDRRLQAAYQQALARPGADQATLTTAQSAFATIRDGCADRVEMRTCVLEAYQTRLVELTIADPATVAPPVVTYTCPADAGTLTAQFYNQLDPKTAVLDWKGVQVILFLQPSGSGARYGRQGSEYWEHQGEVTLDLSGTKFVCRTQ